ncbi:hypothetical protein DITRI_Ditri12bG0017600 [Diplodiscus trichospermus]
MSLPLPVLVLSSPKPDKPLRPSLLIIALSFPTLYIFHHLSPKILIGSVILPEIHFSGIFAEPSLGDKTCNIYSLNDGEDIVPQRAMILDSIQSQDFRFKLSPDETYAFKLEKLAERKGLGGGNVASPFLDSLDYFPSGSMIDGLAAALLSRCQLKNMKGTLCVSWPEFGSSVVAIVTYSCHFLLEFHERNLTRIWTVIRSKKSVS